MFIYLQVTDNNSLVLTNESLDQLSTSQMYNHILRLAKERDRVSNSVIKFKNSFV